MPGKRTANAGPDPAETESRLALEVEGIVQGVGFRPFVYRLAHAQGLDGWVENTVRGVRIEVEGPLRRLEEFKRRLRGDSPPMSRIVRLTCRNLKPAGHDGFVIRASRGGSRRTALVAPDTAVCDECLAEMRDPRNRRYRYPFINCTNCGPRFTIIRDIPYDRANTTMARFQMCPSCRAEFDNPLDRRFHAQPNACPVCGPRASLTGSRGVEIDPEADPLLLAGRVLLEGRILAVKGLGGFHLAADAGNESAVAALRSRKRRQGKPFAVMFPDLETVREYCLVSPAEERVLRGPQRPIVLLRAELNNTLAPSVAPGQATIGALLPYTPLHHLLLDAADRRPLVMTSGNHSDEPIATENQEALERLASIADLFLLHDRPIHLRVDDSVLLVRSGAARPIRRARGFAPAPVRLGRVLPPVLALGGQLKNTVCLVRDSDAFLSQHVGDLDEAETYGYFIQTVSQMRRLLEVTPVLAACDSHPDYLSTRWAVTESGLPVAHVQHHHAHVVSCMAENGLSGPVLGVAFDGTGYGGDGTIWGGEFLLADERTCKRAGHLPYIALPGGEAAMRETWRTARSFLLRVLGQKRLEALHLGIWERAGVKRVEAVDRMIEAGINCPLSSGCGRLFDAVAAIAGLRLESLYEGQVAVELEACAMNCRPGKAIKYDYSVREEENLFVPGLAEMIEKMAFDAASGNEQTAIARGFHETLARLTVETAFRIAQKNGLTRVVLSGGVFNNRLLSGLVERGLRKQGLQVFSHRLVPPGDGGLSLGQAVIAAQTLI